MRKKSLEQIEELLDRRWPTTGHATDAVEADAVPGHASDETPTAKAFDALRGTIDAARTGTFTHQAHLAMIHRALLRAGGPKAPTILVADLLRQVGVAVEKNLDRSELFTDYDGAGDGDAELVDPAYIDERTGRVVQQGIVTRRAAVSA